MKKTWLIAVALVLPLIPAIQGNHLQAQKTGRNLAVLYSNNLNGEVDPCPT